MVGIFAMGQVGGCLEMQLGLIRKHSSMKKSGIFSCLGILFIDCHTSIS